MSRLACRGILFELKKTGFSTMAKSDESWDKQTEVARGVISGLGDKAPCRFSAAFAVNAVIGTGKSTAWEHGDGAWRGGDREYDVPHDRRMRWVLF
jgi:hypothetical protein